MSDSDNTREKLVESMRKTKAEAASTPRKKVVTRKRQASRPAAKSTDSVATKTTQSDVAADPYQSARRVWPD